MIIKWAEKIELQQRAGKNERGKAGLTKDEIKWLN
jgi:hypothetical protein